MEFSHYDPERKTEDGRLQAELFQQSTTIDTHSPEFKRLLLEESEIRDILRKLGNSGNFEARKRADYLDGFLSVFD